MLEGFELVPPLGTAATRAKLDVDGRVYIPFKVVRELELNFTEPRYQVLFNSKIMKVAIRFVTEGKANDGSYPIVRVYGKKNQNTWRFYLQPVIQRYGLQLQAGEVDTAWDAKERILYFDLSSLRHEHKGKKTREVKEASEPEVI